MHTTCLWSQHILFNNISKALTFVVVVVDNFFFLLKYFHEKRIHLGINHLKIKLLSIHSTFCVCFKSSFIDSRMNGWISVLNI